MLLFPGIQNWKQNRKRYGMIRNWTTGSMHHLQSIYLNLDLVNLSHNGMLCSFICFLSNLCRVLISDFCRSGGSRTALSLLPTFACFAYLWYNTQLAPILQNPSVSWKFHFSQPFWQTFATIIYLFQRGFFVGQYERLVCFAKSITLPRLFC